MGHSSSDPVDRPAWNMGRKLGAKRPLKPKEIWAIRFWLDQDHRLRDRALFDLAIDSKAKSSNEPPRRSPRATDLWWTSLDLSPASKPREKLKLIAVSAAGNGPSSAPA